MAIDRRADPAIGARFPRGSLGGPAVAGLRDADPLLTVLREDIDQVRGNIDQDREDLDQLREDVDQAREDADQDREDIGRASPALRDHDRIGRSGVVS